MIVVITYMYTDERTGRKELRASHGVDYDTLDNVVLPDATPQQLGAVWDATISEWVLI